MLAGEFGQAPRYQIALVEDNETDVYLVREALEQGGLDVALRVLSDGEKAVNFIEGIEAGTSGPKPDLMILDLNLPRVMGEKVLQRVRRAPTLASMPVLILSSSESARDKARVFDLGVTAYFKKSSRLEEFMHLGTVVRRLLEDRSAEQASAS